MRKIARLAGVSVAAVSLALRNSPRVSATRRNLILGIASSMGYRSDPRVAELMVHLRRTRADRAPSTVAFVIPELTREQAGHYWPILGMLAGLRAIAARVGFGVDVFYLADPGMNTRRLRSILIARGIRGVIVAPYASGVTKMDFDISGFSAATAGYSIVSPRMHRACPDYLQMMDELVEAATKLGHRRLGLAMTYGKAGKGGNGYKLFTSSFLFYQSRIPMADRIPILPPAEITPAHLKAWLKRHKPDVVISAASVYQMLCGIGVRIPEDVCFASIDLSEPPTDLAGADQRYELVGEEAFQLVLTQINLNVTGEPATPKVILVDSHQRKGSSLVPRGERPVKTGCPEQRSVKNTALPFHGFSS